MQPRLSTVTGGRARATYDTVPLVVEVGALSSYGRRYLELLAKLDQLMPLLQTLEIHEVVRTQVDIERAGLERKVRTWPTAREVWPPGCDWR